MPKDDKTNTKDKKQENSKFTNKNLVLLDTDKAKKQDSKPNKNANSIRIEKTILVKSITKEQVVLPYSYINKNGKLISKSYSLEQGKEIELSKSLVDKVIDGNYKNICELEIIK